MFPALLITFCHPNRERKRPKMATDYSKLKVTELKELLNARSLPVSGKKEDLVARLVENDAAKPTSTNDLLGDLAPPEEEYDWDTPATKANATKTDQKPPAPAPVSRLAVSKASTDSAPHPAQPKKPKSPPAPAPSATPVDMDAEIAAEVERRKKRAERFGIPVSDSVKALERSKRFGTATETTPQTEETKKEARRQRFGNQAWTKDLNQTKAKNVTVDPVEAEKARKRAERFGGGNEPKKVKT